MVVLRARPVQQRTYLQKAATFAGGARGGGRGRADTRYEEMIHCQVASETITVRLLKPGELGQGHHEFVDGFTAISAFES